MARLYAGILGLIALVATLLLGLLRGQSTDAVLLAAWTHLWVFAALGYVFGAVAGHLVDETVLKTVANAEGSGDPPPEASEGAELETST